MEVVAIVVVAPKIFPSEAGRCHAKVLHRLCPSSSRWRGFAYDVGASLNKRVILLLDNAGWHILPDLDVPESLRLVYLPPYSPELQPAETLWTLVDEPIVAKRCLHLIE